MKKTLLFSIFAILSFTAFNQSREIETIKTDSFKFVRPSLDVIFYLFELSDEEFQKKMVQLDFAPEFSVIDSSIAYVQGRFGKYTKVQAIGKSDDDVAISYMNLVDTLFLMDKIERELTPYFISIEGNYHTYEIKKGNTNYFFRLQRNIEYGIEELFCNITP